MHFKGSKAKKKKLQTVQCASGCIKCLCHHENEKRTRTWHFTSFNCRGNSFGTLRIRVPPIQYQAFPVSKCKSFLEFGSICNRSPTIKRFRMATGRNAQPLQIKIGMLHVAVSSEAPWRRANIAGQRIQIRCKISSKRQGRAAPVRPGVGQEQRGREAEKGFERPPQAACFIS
jgi:hypothetical protein